MLRGKEVATEDASGPRGHLGLQRIQATQVFVPMYLSGTHVPKP